MKFPYYCLKKTKNVEVNKQRILIINQLTKKKYYNLLYYSLTYKQFLNVLFVLLSLVSEN